MKGKILVVQLRQALFPDLLLCESVGWKIRLPIPMLWIPSQQLHFAFMAPFWLVLLCYTSSSGFFRDRITSKEIKPFLDKPYLARDLQNTCNILLAQYELSAHEAGNEQLVIKRKAPQREETSSDFLIHVVCGREWLAARGAFYVLHLDINGDNSATNHRILLLSHVSAGNLTDYFFAHEEKLKFLNQHSVAVF